AMNSIKLGEYPMVLAGGVEMPSASPFFITEDQLIDWRDKKVKDIQELVIRADVRDALWCSMHDVHTIVHAENTTASWVEKKGLNREEFKKAIDEYAVLSAERALRALKMGYFSHEIAPVEETEKNDEIPRIKKMSRLSRLRGTHFTPDGLFLTSHNSPPLANGAAYLLLMSRETAYGKKLKPLARITGYSRAGIRPEKFLLAPIKAVKKLLEKTETKISDYDLLEMNTSYGSQILINKDELNLDMNKVNIYGDCIALGHPVGAAGARILTTLIYALKNERKKRGLAAICLGGGNALAISVEREE
ncbi:MAG: thiolase family protein, partial [Spirochaetaceae bacterium]|nr:thiolase family protein [Spirochaetaceae bacterium]